MTALAQGSAGVALVMCFALLRTSQVSAATILLAIQSAAVALPAVILRQPLMAVPPVLLGCLVWLARHQGPEWETPMWEIPVRDHHTAPPGGAKRGIGVGAVLAVLCQSQGALAVPSAIVLLSILLAATRPHRRMQVIALIAAQNGIALAGSIVAEPVSFPAGLLLPAACFALPLPLAAGLLLPSAVLWPNRTALALARSRIGGLARAIPWIDLALALGTLAATLIFPLDGTGSIFAPLLGLDGVMRSWVRRKRCATTPMRRGFALAHGGLSVLAVCAPDLTMAWLAVLGAAAMALLPTLSRRWGSAVLAFLAAGLSLFGLLLLPATQSAIGYFSLFAGFAVIAAVVPDLAAVLVLLLLRLASQAPWPPGAEALGIGVAVIALLSTAVLVTTAPRSHRPALLLLGQASIAALAICTGQPEGRFAALVLLVLLILSRSAARVTDGLAATVARASLGGIPPLGVFPGIVLVVLTLSAYDPWLLLPVGAGLIPLGLASLPTRMPDLSPRPDCLPQKAIPSVAWLPLLLAILAGYFAPDGLVRWWHILTAGRT
jgi:hypothetical protein